MANYGAASAMERGFVAKPQQRMKIGCGAICALVFFPWFLFSLLYFVVTFSVHYKLPWVCWFFVLVGVLIVIAVGAAAWQKVTAVGTSSSWLVLLFMTSVVAAVSGPLLGNMNYWANMQPYYDLSSLNTYSSVNPATSHGQQMMDAGTVTFAPGVALDLHKAYLFQNHDTYCVAPIAMGSQMEVYDFWAVGLNCCGFNKTKSFTYHCGSYDSPTARQGLRLMTENQRDFFRLAVQQAEYTHKLKTKYPVFFYWTENAKADQQSYWAFGYKYYWAGVLVFLLFSVWALFVGSFVISKLEY